MCIIWVMDNTIFEKMSPYLSLGMITVFAVFLILGMLFGFMRGVKRASIRMVILIGLLLVAFFVTPFLANAVLGLDINIAGRTPQEHVNYASEQLMQKIQAEIGDYVAPFQDYIQDYVLGVAFAIANIAVFLVLYIIIKILSWFVYAIVVRFAAPKRNRNGERNPKHAGLGLLVGAVQGILLFVIFMFPLNGLIGMVDQAAAYQAAHTQSEQQLETTAMGGHYSDSDDFDFNGVDIEGLMNKVSQPIQMYSKFMKYSGLQFLSTKALEYQTTVRIQDADNINLIHDANTCFELYIDAVNMRDTVEKIQHIYVDGKIDLTALTADDYQAIRQIVNKVFDLKILNVADHLLADLDEIFKAPFNDDLTLLDGTDIYANSIYGLLIKNNTTSREFTYTLGAGEVAPTNYAQFGAGLQAAINYVGEQKLNLIRQDIINTINLAEILNTYQVSYEGLVQPKTLAGILAGEKLTAKDYFDLSTARLVKTYGDYAKNTPLINVLGDRLINFSVIKLFGLNHVDNLLIYSKAMDNAFGNDKDLNTLVNDLIPMFIGENAFTHNDTNGVKVKGNWEVLGNDLLEVAHVLRNYVTVMDDIDAKKVELKAKGYDDNRLQMQAILDYIADLVISQDEYDSQKTTNPDFIGKSYDEIKFKKIDDLIDALYQLTDDFKPVKQFVINKLDDMGTDETAEYFESLAEMLNQTKEKWQETLHKVVNVANLINNSALGDLVDKIQNLDTENPEDLAQDFIDAVSDLDKDAMVGMIQNAMDIPQVSDAVEQALNEVLSNVKDDDLKAALTQEGLSEDQINQRVADVKGQIETVQDVLKDIKEATTDEAKQALEASLPGTIGDLWAMIQNYQQTIGA